MASVAQVGLTGQGSTQFLVTLDRTEKQRWKLAAERAGLSMAEYVRRAVQQSEEAPSADEIAQARALATEIGASVERMEAMLDRTQRRLDAALDPAAEAARRDAILGDLAARGLHLDLGLLAGDRR